MICSSCNPPALFCKPMHLAVWQWQSYYDDSVQHSRCPWCKCLLRKMYHDSGCPVREPAERIRLQTMKWMEEP